MIQIEDLLQAVNYVNNNDNKINTFQSLFKKDIKLIEYYADPITKKIVSLYQYRNKNCFLLCSKLFQPIVACIRQVIFFDSVEDFKKKWINCEYYSYIKHHDNKFRDCLIKNINKSYFHIDRPTSFAMWRIFNKSIRFTTKRIGNGIYEISIYNWFKLFKVNNEYDCVRILRIENVSEDKISYDDLIYFINYCEII